MYPLTYIGERFCFCRAKLQLLNTQLPVLSLTCMAMHLTCCAAWSVIRTSEMLKCPHHCLRCHSMIPCCSHSTAVQDLLSAQEQAAAVADCVIGLLQSARCLAGCTAAQALRGTSSGSW